MFEAYKEVSVNGPRVAKISSLSINSSDEEREHLPLVDEAGCNVRWRKGHVRDETHVYRHHFYHPPVRLEEQEIRNPGKRKKNRESPVHLLGKELLGETINMLLDKGAQIPWTWRNPTASQFPLSGDLLSEVDEVGIEREIRAPSGSTINADLVLYGQPLVGREWPLVAIELEYTHRFDHVKSLLCRAMGIVLISVDMHKMTKRDVTRDWCKKVLTSLRGLAHNRSEGIHIYLPFLLYPVFLDIPRNLRGDKHKLLILPKDEDYLGLLKGDVDILKKSLHLYDRHAFAHAYNINGNMDVAAEREITRIGPLTGPNWQDYSKSRYITIECEVPTSKRGSIFLYHVGLARLLGADYDTQAGYMPSNRLKMGRTEFPVWLSKDRSGQETVVAPVHLVEPIRRYFDKSLK